MSTAAQGELKPSKSRITQYLENTPHRHHVAIIYEKDLEPVAQENPCLHHLWWRLECTPKKEKKK